MAKKKRKPAKRRAIKSPGKHTDTKSHNVNVSVMSGIKKSIKTQTSKSISDLEKVYGLLSIQKLKAPLKSAKKKISKEISLVSKQIKTLKKHL